MVQGKIKTLLYIILIIDLLVIAIGVLIRLSGIGGNIGLVVALIGGIGAAVEGCFIYVANTRPEFFRSDG